MKFQLVVVTFFIILISLCPPAHSQNKEDDDHFDEASVRQEQTLAPAPEKNKQPSVAKPKFQKSKKHPKIKSFSLGLAMEMPHPYSLVFEYRPHRNWSIGFKGGSYGQTMSGVDVSLSYYSLSAEYFIWGEAFLVGATLGQHSGKGSLTKSYSVDFYGTPTSVRASAVADFSAVFLTPHLGWKWIAKNGVSWGVEAGMVMPFSPSSSISISSDDGASAALLDIVKTTSEFQKSENEARDTVDKFSKTSLPYLSLRLGYWF